MNKRLWFIANTGILILVILLGGGVLLTGQETPQYGGTLTIGSAKDAFSLDPGETNDWASTKIYNNIFDTLVALDKESNIIPHVAKSWESSSNSKEWTFFLRDDIQFHDGTELTAEDVVYTFERILNPKGFSSQKTSMIAMIDRIEAVDEYTVKFYLSIPYAPFLGAARQHIIPKHVVEDIGQKDFSRNPIGSGPFIFDEWVPDDHLTLTGNDNYWLKEPYLTRVVYRPIPEGTTAVMSLLSGEVDVLEEIPGDLLPQVEGKSGFIVNRVTAMNYYWIGFRQYGDPYNNLKFRRMVYYAVNMDEIIEAALPNETGTRAYSIIQPGLWPRDLDYLTSHAIQQDKSLAKLLFDELIAEGVMTTDTEVLFWVNQDPVREKIAEIVVSELQSIGVNAKMRVSEWAAYLDALFDTKSPYLYMLGTTPKIPDPDATLYWLLGAGGANADQFLGIDVPWVNDLLMQARKTSNQDEREELYKTVQRWALLEEVYHIPAYHTIYIHPMSTRVHGLITTPIDEWWLCNKFTNVWVEN